MEQNELLKFNLLFSAVFFFCSCECVFHPQPGRGGAVPSWFIPAQTERVRREGGEVPLAHTGARLTRAGAVVVDGDGGGTWLSS